MKNSEIPLTSELKKLRSLIEKHGVSNLWIFGSYARGESKPGSDIDLLVDFESPPGFDNFMGLKMELEDRLGAKVDLLCRRACAPRFLKAIESELLHVA